MAVPELSRWPSLVRANKVLRERAPDRRACRRELLEKARAFTCAHLGLPCDLPAAAETVIATGHQPIWHHCGLWIKNVACSRLARSVHATAVHVVLDHDVCDTAMAVPRRRADGTWYRQWLDIEPEAHGLALEDRQPHGATTAQFLDDVVRLHPEPFCTEIWNGCGLGNAARWDAFGSVAEVVVYLQALLNAAFGLDNLLYLPVSQLCTSEAFMDFLVSIVSNAMDFATCYNEALAARCGRFEAVGPLTIRPLAMDRRRQQTELPFWLVRSDGTRTPLVVRQDRTGPLTALLRAGRRRLRPKAVPLTLFLRRYLADWFIHGLGGATYEPVVDHVMRAYYGVGVPDYGVVTCTVLLPWCRPGDRGAPHLGQLRHHLHHVLHNPEQCLNASQHDAEQMRRLADRKQRAIARAGDRRLSRDRRKAAWASVSTINQRLRRSATDAITRLEEAIAHAERRQASQAACDSREYFFGLFPRAALRTLADTVEFSARRDMAARERSAQCSVAAHERGLSCWTK